MPTLNNHLFELWWRETGIYLFCNQVDQYVNPNNCNDALEFTRAAKLVAQEAWESAMGSLEELKESYEKSLAAAEGDGYDEGHADGYAEGHNDGYEEGYKQGQDDAPTPTEK